MREKKVKAYVNYYDSFILDTLPGTYEDYMPTYHRTREEADRHAGSHRISCKEELVDREKLDG